MTDPTITIRGDFTGTRQALLGKKAAIRHPISPKAADLFRNLRQGYTIELRQSYTLSGRVVETGEKIHHATARLWIRYTDAEIFHGIRRDTVYPPSGGLKVTRYTNADPLQSIPCTEHTP